MGGHVFGVLVEGESRDDVGLIGNRRGHERQVLAFHGTSIMNHPRPLPCSTGKRRGEARRKGKNSRKSNNAETRKQQSRTLDANEETGSRKIERKEE